MTLLPFALGIPTFIGPIALICWMAGEMVKQPAWWYLFVIVAVVAYGVVYWSAFYVCCMALKGVYLKMTGQDRHHDHPHDDHPAPPEPAPAPAPVVDHKLRPPPADSNAWRRHIAPPPQPQPVVAGGGRRSKHR